MCTDDTVRALMRARDDMEMSLAQARDLVETARIAVAHIGRQDPQEAPIAGTLKIAEVAMERAEDAAKRIAELAGQLPAPTLVPPDETRH